MDSDVHKVLESTCYAMTIDAMGDKEIEDAKAKIGVVLSVFFKKKKSI